MIHETRAKFKLYREAGRKLNVAVIELDDEVFSQEKCIAEKDIFFRDLDQQHNPLQVYLESLAEKYEGGDIAIDRIDWGSINYHVCRKEAVVLAGEEYADVLLKGEVSIREIPRELTLEQRIDWIREHRERPFAIHPEAEDEAPAKIGVQGQALVLDLSDLDLGDEQ